MAEKESTVARNTAVAVGLVLVGLVGLLAVKSGQPEQSIIGEPSPQVAGRTIEGSAYDIANAEGSWVVVNFFATWCPGCITEHPELIKFDQWAAETGEAEIVAVVFNDTPERVNSFFLAQGGNWPVLINPTLGNDFGVSEIPETFLISPTGKIAEHFQGEVQADVLIDRIEKASR